MALGIVAFAVALLVSVLLHEAGHMLTAKAFGMKVTQYFAGFGPTLWSFRRGETEYGVKAIPAGGFVRITGQVSLDDVEPADYRRAMVNKPAWQRFVVLVAGSLTHFVIAIAMFAALFAAYPSPSGRSVIAGIEPCLAAETAAAGTTPAAACTGKPPSPAAGKLRSGDIVLTVDGRTLTSGGPDAVIKAVKAGGSAPVQLTVLRHGQRVPVTVTPRVVGGSPRIGVALSDELAQAGPLAAVGSAFTTFGDGVAQTGHALQSVPGQLSHIFTANRTITGSNGGGLLSVYGAGELSGKAFAASGLPALLSLIAGMNLAIGLFNLFPLLPLDGGHIAVLAFERARSGIARLRRRPDPGLVDYERLAPLIVGLTTVLMVFAVTVLLGDIVNPVKF